MHYIVQGGKGSTSYLLLCNAWFKEAKLGQVGQVGNLAKCGIDEADIKPSLDFNMITQSEKSMTQHQTLNN